MSLKQLNTVLALALIMVVSGCGFKLRGTAEPLPEQVRQLTLVGIDRSGDFYQALAHQLIGAGATLDQIESSEGSALLTIHNVKQSRDEISVSGGLTLYRTNLLVSFSLSRGEQERLIESRQLRASREFSFDSNNPYGLEQQERLLRSDLQRELVAQLVRQIRAAGLARTTVKDPAGASVR
jgi:outer membrane lipopolysaccharide assembly protein LptE/RlpB